MRATHRMSSIPAERRQQHQHRGTDNDLDASQHISQQHLHAIRSESSNKESKGLTSALLCSCFASSCAGWNCEMITVKQATRTMTVYANSMLVSDVLQ